MLITPFRLRTRGGLMKYVTLIFFSFSIISSGIGADDYVPDENHFPPSKLEKQEEEIKKGKDKQHHEKHQDIRSFDDSGYEKFDKDNVEELEQ